MLNPLPEKIVCCDFESYFDKDYTLKKLSTTEYVFDKRFLEHGMSLQANDEPHATWYTFDDIPDALAQYDWDNTALLAHHTQFEALILKYYYDVIPAYYLDTMSMARPLIGTKLGEVGLDRVAKYLGFGGKVKADILGELKGVRHPTKAQLRKLGEYCCDDVEDTWRIFRVFFNEWLFPLEELDLIDITVRMYGNPIFRLDEDVAQQVLRDEQLKTIKQLRKVANRMDVPGFGKGQLDRTKKILGSNPQFAELLKKLKIEPPMKVSPTTGKDTFAFAKNDLGFQALQEHKDPLVRDITEARINTKSNINETRVTKLIERGAGARPIPVYLKYCGAHTFRWSGGDKINFQNFPNLHKSNIRKALLAPKNYQIVVVDSSQIEARMLAWVADQFDLLDIFAANGDPYAEFATDLYGYKVSKDNKDTKQERQVGKVCVLGLGYGMGWRKLQNTLEVGAMSDPIILSDEEAKRAVKLYRTKNYNIRKFWTFAQSMLKIMSRGDEYDFGIMRFHAEGVDMPNGLTMYYPRLAAYKDADFGMSYQYWQGRYYTKIYGGLFTENLIQCLSRIALGQQMIEIAREYPVISMTHDEVIYLAHDGEAETALALGYECLRTAPEWCADLPFDAEGGYAREYSK